MQFSLIFSSEEAAEDALRAPYDLPVDLIFRPPSPIKGLLSGEHRGFWSIGVATDKPYTSNDVLAIATKMGASGFVFIK